MIKKIISGGQTGADRAGLDIAIVLNIPHGGWIPKGRKTEDGPLSPKYHLKETSSAKYPPRTERNILDSDGTLIIAYGPLKKRGGTALTYRLAVDKHYKPCKYIDLNQTTIGLAARVVANWIKEHSIEVLNVAGPRGSREPNIYEDVCDLLELVVQ